MKKFKDPYTGVEKSNFSGNEFSGCFLLFGSVPGQKLKPEFKGIPIIPLAHRVVV